MSAFTFPVLLADIGGTNARFQVLEAADSTAITFKTVKTADFSTIEDALRAVVLDQGYQPKTALIAAAGPIKVDGLDLTNCHWRIKANAFVNNLKLDHLILFNDFDAQALALPFLTKDDVSSLGGVGLGETKRTMGVVGAGTGLGVGTLARAAGKWVPVGGEGGHVDLGPRTERESTIWPHLERIGGRISAEQVLCGDGLVNLYRAVCGADRVEPSLQTASDISTAAMEGRDDQAYEALSIFCACFGRVAGDLALTVMAKGGVFVAGGIAGHILSFLQQSGMRRSFDDKEPHSELMEAIGLHVVTHKLPALLGLASYACQPDAFAIDLEHRSWKSA
ncbi:glucokinase [Pseudahrensia aquimaris]|uniref:Glucokinase n=1 Tax=Pseudahrensia aquimaris TaxID=744461 RepID=A0ABW3FH80_9HYPH